MNIAILQPHLGLFGGTRRMLEIGNRLTDRGHRVTIYHSDGAAPEWMECRAGVRPALEILDGEFDALLFNDPTWTDHRLAIRTRATDKYQFVLELYDHALLAGYSWKLFWPTPWYRRTLILKKMFRREYHLMVNATWMIDWLRSRLGLEANLMIGGVNFDLFHPAKPKTNCGKELVILHSGSLRMRKGLETVTRALERVKTEEPGVRVETYSGRGIPQEKMAEVYSRADIFVDAQEQGGWNNPVVEAMACGTPVVCTDIGAVQDFAEQEETALIVPVGNATAMAEAILRLIRDCELRERLATNALHVVQSFRWEEAIDRLEDFLTHPPPAPRGKMHRWEVRLLDGGEDALIVAADFLKSRLQGLLRPIRGKKER